MSIAWGLTVFEERNESTKPPVVRNVEYPLPRAMNLALALVCPRFASNVKGRLLNAEAILPCNAVPGCDDGTAVVCCAADAVTISRATQNILLTVRFHILIALFVVVID